MKPNLGLDVTGCLGIVAFGETNFSERFFSNTKLSLSTDFRFDNCGPNMTHFNKRLFKKIRCLGPIPHEVRPLQGPNISSQGIWIMILDGSGHYPLLMLVKSTCDSESAIVS